MNASAHLVRGIGLQLSVRHVADVVVVDLHGKATIGRDNDLLDNQLRQLIDEGSSKILLNLADVTQMDSSGSRELQPGCYSIDISKDSADHGRRLQD